MKTAISYRRVSSEGQVDNYSLATQDDAIRQYAQEHGFEVIKDFAEPGVTGTALDRPALNELREFIKGNKVDAVIFYDPNRIARLFRLQMYLTVEIEQMGARVAIVNGEIGNTPEEKLLYNMRGVFAEYELTQILERTLRGRRARIKSGRLAHGNASYLYGYQYVRGEGKRVIDPETSKIVKDIYCWFVEERLPIDRIIHRLKDFGILSPKGKSVWASSSVWGLLKKRAYTGDAFTPGIIDQKTYDKAQAQLKYNQEMAARNTKREYLLRGHLFCAHCGRRYRGVTRKYPTKAGVGEYQYYRCNAAHRISVTPCHNPSWGGKKLDDIVWKEVEAVLSNPQMVMAGLKAMADSNSSLQKELNQIDVHLKEIDEQQRQLLQWALRGFSEQLIAQENGRLNQSRSELTKHRAELQDRIKRAQDSQLKIDEIEKACQIIRGNLGSLSFEDKRLALSALSVKVWLDGEDILVDGNLPIPDDAIALTPLWRSENKASFSIPVINR